MPTSPTLGEDVDLTTRDPNIRKIKALNDLCIELVTATKNQKKLNGTTPQPKMHQNHEHQHYY